MKVLTSRVVLYAIVSIFAGFVAQPVYAEDKITEGGGATLVPKAETTVKSGGSETRKIVASQKYVDDQVGALAAHKVNGALIKNESSTFFGRDESAPDQDKKVEIESIASLEDGIIIVVQPKYTSVKAGSTLKLNSFDAVPMYYNGHPVTAD